MSGQNISNVEQHRIHQIYQHIAPNQTLRNLEVNNLTVVTSATGPFPSGGSGLAGSQGIQGQTGPTGSQGKTGSQGIQG